MYTARVLIWKKQNWLTTVATGKLGYLSERRLLLQLWQLHYDYDPKKRVCSV